MGAHHGRAQVRADAQARTEVQARTDLQVHGARHASAQGALGAGALGAQAGARGRRARERAVSRHGGHRRAALRHSAGLATTRPRARGLGAACARRLSCGCAHGALGQFLTQYCY